MYARSRIFPNIPKYLQMPVVAAVAVKGVLYSHLWITHLGMLMYYGAVGTFGVAFSWFFLGHDSWSYKFLSLYRHLDSIYALVRGLLLTKRLQDIFEGELSRLKLKSLDGYDFFTVLSFLVSPGVFASMRGSFQTMFFAHNFFKLFLPTTPVSSSSSPFLVLFL